MTIHGDNSADPLVTVKDVEVHFPARASGAHRKECVRALDGVSLKIDRRSTMGLVGESGSGKSTLGRVIVGAISPNGGSVEIAGQTTQRMSRSGRKRWRSAVQLVFQDPFDALNPRMRIGASIVEPLITTGWGDTHARRDRVDQLLDQVGLDHDAVDKFPHEFSGGQLQRVVIARAIATNPALVVCDEPTSALDVSTQATIVNLLKRLQAELGLTYLFISHDLGIVRQVSDSVAVMYGGRIVEVGSARAFFSEPLHPYSAGLMATVPRIDVDGEGMSDQLVPIGEPFDPSDDATGCRYAPRCPFATEGCFDEYPAVDQVADSRLVACHEWRPLRENGALTSVQAPRGRTPHLESSRPQNEGDSFEMDR